MIDEGCPLGELIKWINYKNTQVMGGMKSAARSVRECQKACLRDPSCNGVDWDASAGRGYQCWLHGPWSKHRKRYRGVTHYDMKRICISNGTLVVFS